jgi:hypothetical protein
MKAGSLDDRPGIARREAFTQQERSRGIILNPDLEKAYRTRFSFHSTAETFAGGRQSSTGSSPFARRSAIR